MARRRRKSGGSGWLVALCLVAFVCAAVVAYYVFSGGGGGPIRPEKKPVIVKPPVVTPIPVSRKITIFLPRESAGRFYLAPMARSTEAEGDILDVAVKTLLATNTSEKGAAAGLIPKGTKLLSPIKVKGVVAEVNLSRKFVDNFTGGADQEALTLNSIVHTLVRNSGGKVETVQILVEGKAVESLGGHFDLTAPIAADSTLLKPGS